MEKKITDAITRIKVISELFNVTPYALAKQIGLKRPDVLYNILDGKTKHISGELALKIHAVYSTLNFNWLLTGEGKMIDLNNNDGGEVTKDKAIIELNKKWVELDTRVKKIEKIIKEYKI